jgi:hypothetical protein
MTYGEISHRKRLTSASACHMNIELFRALRVAGYLSKGSG